MQSAEYQENTSIIKKGSVFKRNHTIHQVVGEMEMLTQCFSGVWASLYIPPQTHVCWELGKGFGLEVKAEWVHWWWMRSPRTSAFMFVRISSFRSFPMEKGIITCSLTIEQKNCWGVTEGVPHHRDLDSTCSHTLFQTRICQHDGQQHNQKQMLILLYFI